MQVYLQLESAIFIQRENGFGGAYRDILRLRMHRLFYNKSAKFSSSNPRLIPRIGLKTSKIRRPTPSETKAVAVPTIPQDIVNEILDHLSCDSDFQALRTCALVSKSWAQLCPRHLFHTVNFTSRNVDRWFKTFQAPEDSPAHYVRDLCVWIGGDCRVPEKFFVYTSWFTGVDRICLLGYGGLPPSLGPAFWGLPQSVTTLVIDTNVVTIMHVRNIMAQLPNLANLYLSGSLAAMDRRELPKTVLRVRFGGKLILYSGYVGKDVINMLSEIKSGLGFAEVRIHCTRERLPSAV